MELFQTVQPLTERRVNFAQPRAVKGYRPPSIGASNCFRRIMLDMIMTIGPAVSAGFVICGGFITLDHALFPEHRTATPEELLEIGYDW
jgi:hypothetical protein